VTSHSINVTTPRPTQATGGGSNAAVCLLPIWLATSTPSRHAYLSRYGCHAVAVQQVAHQHALTCFDQHCKQHLLMLCRVYVRQVQLPPPPKAESEKYSPCTLCAAVARSHWQHVTRCSVSLSCKPQHNVPGWLRISHLALPACVL
jgi:hypothetical protein